MIIAALLLRIRPRFIRQTNRIIPFNISISRAQNNPKNVSTVFHGTTAITSRNLTTIDFIRPSPAVAHQKAIDSLPFFRIDSCKPKYYLEHLFSFVLINLPLGMPQGPFVRELSKKSKSYFLAGGNVRATWPSVWSTSTTNETKATSNMVLVGTIFADANGKRVSPILIAICILVGNRWGIVCTSL